MFDVANYSISFIQISSDISCVLISAFLSKCIKTNRLFYLLNFFSFIALSFSDLYYNYFYRILQENILQSAQLLETLPLLIFQFLQSINWYILLKKETKIISWLNLPYLLFAAIVTAIFGYFFYITHSLSSISTMEDIFTVAIDMCIWVFTIISLGRTKNSAIALLALGCLMIVSSDLTFTCLFMFDMKNVGITNWPHLVWAVGAFLMMLGLIRSKNQINLTFYDPNSIHAKSNWWLLMSSLIAFLIGLALPFFFIESDNVYTIRYALWDVPISLMFTMIASTLLSNRFSRVILSPIKSFSNSIESFNMGKQSEILVSSDINEIKILEQFINKSFKELSGKLEQEVKISAQVAHDVRSPLSALEVVIKSLPSSFDESKRILLRDAVQHIRDITNNLDKTDAYSNSNIKYPSQVSVLVDNVVSERRLARQERNIKLEQLYGSDTYEYFSEIVPSMLKRILSNILNNSYEAIDCASGIITVSIKEFNGMCVLSIRDNGHGISNSDMKSLFNRGFSTKKNGSGLGLYHANETLIEWGGRIEVNSTIHIGTEVSIRIPLVPPSPWFVSKLSLIENDIVVCIDDSSSVYQVWLERFKFLKANVKLIYCPSKQSFLKEFENLKYKAVTYLIDYEYSGKDYQGFDFTNMILTLDNVKNRIIMVSSRSSEEKIQDYCIQNSIHIIPKNFSVKIPLEIFDTSIKKVILVAICDKYTNQLDNCEWHKYSNANDLISDLPYFNSSYQVFIQRNVFTQHLKDKFKKYEIIANEFDKILDLL